MPAINNKKDKAAKTGGLKSLFKRYNQEKVTAKGIKQFFTAIFYRLGYSAELTVILTWKKIRKFAYVRYRKLKRIFKEVRIFADRFFGSIFDDLGLPFARIKSAFINIKKLRKLGREDSTRQTGKEVRDYVAQGFKKNRQFVPVLVSYLVPALCFAVMVAVITFGLKQGYAVKVSLDGQEIGVIDNYTVLKNADTVIKNKLVTLDDSQQWSMNPEIKITTKLGNTIVDERRLSDAILQASEEDIVSATGLYVDGEFHGAVENVEPVQAAIDSMLAPYDDGAENKTVGFVQDVSLTEGIFFTDTIVDESKLTEKITGLVEGEVWYTVVQGDSPSLIANKNGLRLRELYNLNPELEGGGLWVGDQVLVSQAVPFLQVKEVVREVREIETAYATEQRSNNSMNLGTTKTVQKGEKGLNKVTVDVTYIDGIAQSETVIETVVIKEPVKEIIEVGRYLPSVGVLQNVGSGAFGWPTGGGVRISRGFAGQYPAHNGVDIAGPYGTPIYASDDGIVTTAKYTNRGYGVYLIVDHGNGYQTVYAHCSSLLVGYGEQVKKGQLIARMGSTGNSTGNHLHFEIKSGNHRYDPYKFW
ncbi:MAG: peptidoglycan DD-metalloendopeptidase family protein [Oscillospiraceae bacterium]|nr:peptidoglycan DD-metalloendopeptidase family protein [Oscillospiraceae bacterium]